MTVREAPALVRLRPETLREQALAAIRASIITGEAEQGRIYSVRQFADNLGVSATPVREALLDLASQGLVEAVRNVGFRVVTPSERDLEEIYQLRLMIEVPGILLAGSCMTANVEARCREYAAAATSCAAEGDLAGFLAADRSFHLAALACSGNKRLVEIVTRLRDETRLVGLPGLRGTATLVASAEEHVAILDALSRADGLRASILMQRHLDHTRGIWAGVPEREGVNSDELSPISSEDAVE